MEPEKETVPEPAKLNQIRTFQGDLATAINKQNESIISIQRAEETRREAIKTLGPKEVENLEGEGSKRALVLALLTLVLAGLGAAGAFYVYVTYEQKTAPPIVSTPLNQFVSASTVVPIDASTLSRQAVIGVVTAERAKARGENEITQINFLRGSEVGSETLTSDALLTRLNVHAPQPLIRAMGPMFMIGVLGSSPSHTLLIIEIDSFENAFPGMLEWEARIIEDLMPLFAEGEELEKVPTSGEWRDVVIQNRDTRVLRNTDGEVALIYAFFENRLLIITDNESTFRLISERLESQKLTR